MISRNRGLAVLPGTLPRFATGAALMALPTPKPSTGAPAARILSMRFAKSVINSCASLSYKEAQAMMLGRLDSGSR